MQKNAFSSHSKIKFLFVFSTYNCEFSRATSWQSNERLCGKYKEESCTVDGDRILEWMVWSLGRPSSGVVSE